MRNKILRDKRLLGIVLYLLFIVFVVWFVDTSLNTKEVEEKSDEEEQAFQERFVYVNLRVDNGSTIREYEAYLKNTNSVLSLIDNIREEQDLTYERAAYSYGTEFVTVNGVTASGDLKWHLYDRDREITYNEGSELIRSGHTYSLILKR